MSPRRIGVLHVLAVSSPLPDLGRFRARPPQFSKPPLPHRHERDAGGIVQEARQDGVHVVHATSRERVLPTVQRLEPTSQSPPPENLRECENSSSKGCARFYSERPQPNARPLSRDTGL